MPAFQKPQKLSFSNNWSKNYRQDSFFIGDEPYKVGIRRILIHIQKNRAVHQPPQLLEPWCMAQTLNHSGIYTPVSPTITALRESTYLDENTTA